MTTTEQTQKIRDFLINHIGSDKFSDKEDLFKQGLVNSLFAMELVNFIETEFGFEISNEDLKLDNFRSVDALNTLVLKNKN
ncbi:acyl carrier protein [uncultured Draconibacterium sp.]|uniref:acyl carrier protein n=1 Tax=uncultured Draconibacterium sp. TaxID=1573823 RepID=UPI0025E2029F|nr:acyl carrier protein [uncultured Draconibacterium sp.]